MKPVFSSDMGIEVEQVASMLRGAGFDAVVMGAQAQSVALFSGMVVSQVQVPDEEFDDALAFLEKSKIELDAPEADASLVEGNVCPVHEKQAIAVCDRCGTFLCADCGALGKPPICEQCMARPVEAKPLPWWVRLTAQAWATVWLAQLVVGFLIGAALWAAWFFGFFHR